MVDPNVPHEVQRLLANALTSMDHVEVLFRVWSAERATREELARATHLDGKLLDSTLRDLEEAKLLTKHQGIYRVTDHPAERAAVDMVAEMYNTRPVTLVRAVYARPSPVTTFAEAFRLRRDEER